MSRPIHDQLDRGYRYQQSESSRDSSPDYLVQSAKNAWQPEKYQKSLSSHQDENTCETFTDYILNGRDDLLDSFYTACKSRAVRRYLLISTTIVLFTVGLWMYVIVPRARETRAVLAFREGTSALGSNIRPEFSDVIHVGSLPPEYLPGSPNSRLTKRLIFVGDIHGCKKELVKLLEKVHYDAQTDHLVTVGDVVNKGPDSIGVVDLLHDMNASCVRGNNEDRLLLEAERLKSMLAPSQDDPAEGDRVRKLARELNATQMAYLKACPVFLRIGDVASTGNEVIVVHGGMVPGLPLEKQDANLAMNMRIIDLHSHMPSKDDEAPGSVPWAQLFNKYQRLLPAKHSRYGPHKNDQYREGHVIVVYGHDSKRGLQIRKYTKGLDSACYKGGKLTALTMEEDGKQHIVQVSCEDYTLLG